MLDIPWTPRTFELVDCLSPGPYPSPIDSFSRKSFFLHQHTPCRGNLRTEPSLSARVLLVQQILPLQIRRRSHFHEDIFPLPFNPPVPFNPRFFRAATNRCLLLSQDVFGISLRSARPFCLHFFFPPPFLLFTNLPPSDPGI